MSKAIRPNRAKIPWQVRKRQKKAEWLHWMKYGGGLHWKKKPEWLHRRKTAAAVTEAIRPDGARIPWQVRNQLKKAEWLHRKEYGGGPPTKASAEPEMVRLPPAYFDPDQSEGPRPTPDPEKLVVTNLEDDPDGNIGAALAVIAWRANKAKKAGRKRDQLQFPARWVLIVRTWLEDPVPISFSNARTKMVRMISDVWARMGTPITPHAGKWHARQLKALVRRIAAMQKEPNGSVLPIRRRRTKSKP